MITIVVVSKDLLTDPGDAEMVFDDVSESQIKLTDEEVEELEYGKPCEEETPTPDIPKIKVTEAHEEITLAMGVATVTQPVRIVQPQLVDDISPDIQLVQILKRLHEVEGVEKPLLHSAMQLEEDYYLVVSDILMPVDPDNLLYGSIVVREASTDPRLIEEILNAMAENHRPVVWPDLDKENKLRGRNHTTESYLLGMNFCLPSTATKCMNDDRVFMRR